jgi:hypothetical protein
MKVDNDIEDLSSDPELERMSAEWDVESVRPREQIKRTKVYVRSRNAKTA